MSTASPLPTDRLESSRRTLTHLITTPIEATAFWTAIVTPLAYPALLAGGLTGHELPLLALVLAVNVAALVLGHNYKTE